MSFHFSFLYFRLFSTQFFCPTVSTWIIFNYNVGSTSTTTRNTKKLVQRRRLRNKKLRGSLPCRLPTVSLESVDGVQFHLRPRHPATSQEGGYIYGSLLDCCCSTVSVYRVFVNYYSMCPSVCLWERQSRLNYTLARTDQPASLSGHCNLASNRTERNGMERRAPYCGCCFHYSRQFACSLLAPFFRRYFILLLLWLSVDQLVAFPVSPTPQSSQSTQQ